MVLLLHKWFRASKYKGSQLVMYWSSKKEQPNCILNRKINIHLAWCCVDSQKSVVAGTVAIICFITPLCVNGEDGHYLCCLLKVKVFISLHLPICLLWLERFNGRYLNSLIFHNKLQEKMGKKEKFFPWEGQVTEPGNIFFLLLVV